jgi:pimeloyl-ACP methyl ester carboxylesterase
VTLIGYSWGAWLAFIVAARDPALVRQLILVSSGPFEEDYVAGMHATRMSRLSDAERAEFERLLVELADPAAQGADARLARLGALASRADTFEALPDLEHDRDPVGPQAEAFQGVWATASEMRRSGELLRLGRQITCPVIAIHGDHDPHPAEGVSKPLSAVLPDVRFVLLEKCGHKPWVERHARAAFYRIITRALTHDR